VKVASRAVGRQFVSVLSARVVGAVLQAGIGIALARALDPETYGVVAIVAGVALVWFIACDFGVSSAIGRARAMGDEPYVDGALAANRVLLALGTVGAVATLVGVFWTFPGESMGLALPLCLLLAAQAVERRVEVYVSLAIADGRTLFSSVSPLVRRGSAAVALAVGLVVWDQTVWTYCGAMLLGATVGWVHGRLCSRSPIRVPHTPSVMLGALRRTSSFAVNDLAVQSRSLDAFAVGAFAGAGGAGIYAIGAKLLAPFELLSGTAAAIVLPWAARSDIRTIRRSALLAALLAAVLYVPVLPLMLFAEQLVVALTGEAYREAAPVLVLMLVGLPPALLGPPAASLLQAVGHSSFVARNSVFFSVVTIAGIAVGALADGATGAAVGLTAAVTLKSLVLLVRLQALKETSARQ
jgi:O-antigen/teichoic acid export membrane protein